MKTSERDELLVKVDERTRNIWRVVEKLEEHQSEQNGYIRDNLLATNRNTTWRKITVWTIGGLVMLALPWLIILTLGG